MAREQLASLASQFLIMGKSYLGDGGMGRAQKRLALVQKNRPMMKTTRGMAKDGVQRDG